MVIQVKSINRLKLVYKLYSELGTYQAVGDKLGLTRERIRQILKQGVELGLFKFQTRAKETMHFLKSTEGKEKILSMYNKGCCINDIVQHFKISRYSFKNILRVHGLYGVDGEIWDNIKLDKRKKQCLVEYLKVRNKVGVYPNTTILQKVSHKLDARINSAFGSFTNFCDYAGLKTTRYGRNIKVSVK